MAGGQLYCRVHGTAGLAKAAQRFGEEGWALFVHDLGEAADKIKEGVQQRYLTVNSSGPDERGAEGVDTRVNAKGAAVFQTLRKSENVSLRRPNYGPRMMLKAFRPALQADRAYVVAQARAALEEAKLLYWRG